MSKLPTKALELMLAGWRESNNSGFVVSFFVQPDDEDYFRHATARKGKIAGQRYQAVLVQLTDDEKPDPESLPPPKSKTPLEAFGELVDQCKAMGVDPALVLRHPAPPPEQEAGTKPRAHKSHFPEGLCGLAVRWCDDPHFHTWLDEVMVEEMARAAIEAKTPEDQAKAVVLDVCKITSRKELDTSDLAAHLFRELIMEPYKQHREDEGVDKEHF